MASAARTSRTTRQTKVPPRPGKRLLAHDRTVLAEMGAPELGIVAGVDEAGRGSLAGPIVIAAVALMPGLLVGPDVATLNRLDDSKKLSADVRDLLYDHVVARATAFTVISISAATIDREGLHKCNLRGMREALTTLYRTLASCPPAVSLVDGFALADMPFECRQIIRGDSTSAAIAAASIIAKVTRDRHMHRLDDELDRRWAFTDHAGYATPVHAECIARHGVSHHHRHSYNAAAYIDAPAATIPLAGSITTFHLHQ